jgi:hypothetical protein
MCNAAQRSFLRCRFSQKSAVLPNTLANIGLDSDIGHGLFVGWVEHPDIFCWVSPPPADQPTCQPFFAVSETQQNGLVHHSMKRVNGIDH